MAQVQIVNTNGKYPKPALVDPTPYGYIYLAAAVHPGATPRVPPSTERQRVLEQLKDLAGETLRAQAVMNVTIFRAIVIPPTRYFSSYVKRRKASLRVANFDVMMLLQITSPAAVREVQASPEFAALVDALRSKARSLCVMPARNAKRIADVDTAREGGLFLFNHFAADDSEVMLELWDYLAGWYVVETGLQNSLPLVPLVTPSDYAIVNFARWDESPLRHFWHQLSKPTFWKYVLPNLEANRAVAMPIYCRLEGKVEIIGRTAETKPATQTAPLESP